MHWIIFIIKSFEFWYVCWVFPGVVLSVCWPTCFIFMLQCIRNFVCSWTHKSFQYTITFYIVQCYLLFNHFYDFHFLDKVCLVSVCDNILISTVFEYFLSIYILYVSNLNCFSLFIFCPLLGYTDLECEIGNYPRNVVNGSNPVCWFPIWYCWQYAGP